MRSCDRRRPERGGGHAPLAARPADVDDRFHREQDRERVAGRRGVGDVAADRRPVLDLGRADGRRRIDERRHELAAQGGLPDLSERRQRAEDERSLLIGPVLGRLDGDAPEFLDAPDVEARGGWSADLAGDLDEQVRGAGDGPQRRIASAEASSAYASASERAVVTGGSTGI